MIFRNSPAINTLEERRQAGASIRCLNSGRLPRMILSVLLPVLPVLPALAQDTENADNPDTDAPIVETIVKPVAVFYESSNLKDPFFHPAPPKVAAKPNVDEEIPRGDAPPGIAGTYIEKAGLEGIVIRHDNRRTAIIRGADNRAYFLREGDRLFDGYLETIQDDSVVFVRETFMRSGKTQTEEIPKRLRKS